MLGFRDQQSNWVVGSAFLPNFTYAIVGGTGGILGLIYKSNAKRIINLAYLAAGVSVGLKGGALAKRIKPKGETHISGQDIGDPRYALYVSNSFAKPDLDETDFVGFTLTIETSFSVVIGVGASVMLLGIECRPSETLMTSNQPIDANHYDLHSLLGHAKAALIFYGATAPQLGGDVSVQVGRLWA